MTLSEKWQMEYVENEIMEYLDKGKKVFIENGCLNDEITSYSIDKELREREVIFTTFASVFPLHINFMGEPFSNVDTEEFEGNLFVKVS